MIREAGTEFDAFIEWHFSNCTSGSWSQFNEFKKFYMLESFLLFTTTIPDAQIQVTLRKLSRLLWFTKLWACTDIMINPTCLDRYSMAWHSSWVPLGSLQPFHAMPPEQCREFSNLPSLRPLYTVSCRINELDASIWTQTSLWYQVWSSTTSETCVIHFSSVKRPKCGILCTFWSISQTHEWFSEFPDGRS